MAEESLATTPNLFSQLVSHGIRIGVFHDLCDYNQKNIDVLENLATNSYQHENEFSKIILAMPYDIPFRLRLHIWPSTSVVEQNIHDHRFDFWSFVISGQIINTEWTTQNGVIPMGHYIYSSRQGEDAYNLRWNGEQSLTRLQQTKIAAGSAYHVNKSTLHTVSTYDGGALTVFVEDRRLLKDYANVYSRRYKRCNVRLASPSISVNGYLRAVSDFIECL